VLVVKVGILGDGIFPGTAEPCSHNRYSVRSWNRTTFGNCASDDAKTGSKEWAVKVMSVAVAGGPGSGGIFSTVGPTGGPIGIGVTPVGSGVMVGARGAAVGVGPEPGANITTVSFEALPAASIRPSDYM
jgi:hypothetical protein